MNQHHVLAATLFISLTGLAGASSGEEFNSSYQVASVEHTRSIAVPAIKHLEPGDLNRHAGKLAELRLKEAGETLQQRVEAKQTEKLLQQLQTETPFAQ